MFPAPPTDAEWAALSEDDRDEYLSLQAELVEGESLTAFINRLSPHHPPPPHLVPLIEELESCLIRQRKICISLPPRHAKTTLILHALAWWCSRFPADTSAYYSYNEQMGQSKSVMARALAARAGVSLSAEINMKSEWRTTDGGGLLAGGIDSGLTGHGVSGLLVIDDPFKGPTDAYSQNGRDRVFQWFTDVPMTRREGASVIVIHTRWHEDDLIGRLEKTGDWTIINFPAIAEEDDWLGEKKREPGTVLWADRFSLEDILERKKTLGEFSFAALFQGRPRPRGGTVFGEPHYYDPEDTSFEGCIIIIAADPAASEKTSADYSAAVVLSIKGRGVEAVGYVRRVYRKQVAIPTFVTDLKSLQQTFGNAAIHVEATGGFKAIPQMLRALGLKRINEIIPMGDKFTRAQGVAAAWNGGRVLVPADNPPWLGEFLDELAKFTGVNDAHDDQVDALAHGWNTPRKVSMWDVM